MNTPVNKPVRSIATPGVLNIGNIYARHLKTSPSDAIEYKFLDIGNKPEYRLLERRRRNYRIHQTTSTINTNQASSETIAPVDTIY